MRLDLVEDLFEQRPFRLRFQNRLDARWHPFRAFPLRLRGCRWRRCFGSGNGRRRHVCSCAIRGRWFGLASLSFALEPSSLFEVPHELLLLVSRPVRHPVLLREVVRNFEAVDGRLACGAVVCRVFLHCLLRIDSVASDGKDGVGCWGAEPRRAVATVEGADRGGMRREQGLEVLIEADAVEREQVAGQGPEC